MIKKILISILFSGFLFGQIYTSQDVDNAVYDNTNGALQTNVIVHYANDGMYNAVTTVNQEINSLNTGEAFTYTILDDEVDAADSLIVSFVTPNSDIDIHLNFEMRVSKAARCFLLETPTMTAALGTDAAVIQMNRGSAVTSTILSSSDSTVAEVTYHNAGHITGLGTTLDSYTFSTVNQEYISEEWILDTYKRYAILLISDTEDAIVAIKIKIIEHTPDDD